MSWSLKRPLLVEPTLDNICELTFSHLANYGKTNGLTLETITTYMGELIEQVRSNVRANFYRYLRPNQKQMKMILVILLLMTCTLGVMELKVL